MRILNVAAAQMGPIQKAESREAVVQRMLALLDDARAKGADLVVYPELALTTFFPRYYMTDRPRSTAGSRPDAERGDAALFEAAAEANIARSRSAMPNYRGRASFQYPDTD